MTLTRRQAIAMGLALPIALQTRPATATPEAMQAAIDAFTGGAEMIEGGVELKIPALVENGNSVPLSVRATSPMTTEDYVEEIAVFNEINPLPDTVRFRFSPRSGRAEAQTRIRLNGSQHVTAIVRHSNGDFHSTQVNVIVTAPACREA
ncbi:thiosulfate oxidation carrier protein SoxY [Ponticoccus sp. SC2-23]|uniref:thiosulfate oxidation carrier protein SoxY n=1 Tax=Alexandriicola marinus TaxID=2081710 RepID=UPI0013DF88AF|nr:thiosulfate oxidation carrier protein SoxY [Alexandriicola marinus]MBM1221007.1 thiosulfate oxidation carrier protein SoxY [Ponticoccus sp. SC6-9]MBM1225577.1 thiosulfate oxidation carrier protein SoxY [Ponticoccus sp. SC6-15]MBM1227729.1 thiosulfate oxidation carrier protein SoxY [Ponticoccus sp. SC6-38]MBM1234633.1 thiosulfate oxidation carrier protein SoxY [Ponticoccus sp. SC6-45]MBM1238231.1 thiosulfate oxidation carrier protein SoxY [Ponticoccus sp. SC6-49]MBM1243500.1 thiosulfate oxi